MSELTATDIRTKSAYEVLNGAIDFTSKMRSAEKLTGTPTVTATPTGLAFASVAVNTSAIEEDGFKADIGKAVQFSVSGGTAGIDYLISAKCGSDSTPAQSLEVFAVMKVRAS